MKNVMLTIFFHWVIVLALAPLFVGVIAKVKAMFAGKKGAPVVQPYFELARLFRKQCVYSRTTTWIFRASPIVGFGAVLLFALLLPLGVCKAPMRFSGDILLAAYILALARFFMITAALDTGNSFEGMGSSREAFFSCLSELALFMNFITLAIMTRSISFSRMIGADVPLSWPHSNPVLLLVVASLFIVLLPETCRIPVDDPDTHLELTMIHEVMILDHSGVDLAYLLYAGAVKLFLFAGIIVPLLIPFRTGDPVKDMAVFLAGMLGMAVFIGAVESSMARLRLNRVRNLLLIAAALAFFGFVVALWRGGA